MVLHLHLLIFFLLCLFNETHSKKTEKECLSEIKGWEASKNEVSDNEFLLFFKDCVADFYGFKSTTDKKMWETTPDLGKVLYTDHFTATAKAIEKFFKKTNVNMDEKRDWENIKEAMNNADNPLGITNDKQCPNMLLVVAARQVYVTYLLREAARKAFEKEVNEEGRFKHCDKEEGKFIIPNNTCYPTNAGSTRCTSDYDVSLLGPTSGSIVPIYNKHFTDVFGMTSDALFDNNLYAFSLEFALPELFKLGNWPGEKAKKYFDYLKNLKEKNKDIANYQSQNIALAYIKVHMFEPKEEDFYEKQKKKCLIRGVYKMSMNTWLGNLDSIKKTDWTKMTQADKAKEYESLISKAKDPWEKEYTARLNLAISEVYASESYFSKGAIRVVVGSQQMKNKLITEGLTTVDHWCSFIENFGDVLKEHERSCKGNTNIYKCLLKLSKYLNRSFKSIEVLLQWKISNKIKGQATDCPTVEEEEDAITRFNDTKDPSPVEITTSWITCFKDKSDKQIAENYNKDDCPEAATLNERKDWAKYFLRKVLACSDDKLNAQSVYTKPPPPEPKEQSIFEGFTIQGAQTEPEEELDTENCISKLKFLIRGVNRRMLSYADTKTNNLGLPV